MRNAKYEFVNLWNTTHWKYRLWMWRLLTYDMALLSEKEGQEYRCNQTVNTKGGLGLCIPNDNFIQAQFKSIKKNMARNPTRALKQHKWRARLLKLSVP